MRILLAAIAGLVVCCAASAYAASSADSFDQQMQKCEVCKVMAAKPDLMKNMTWKTHKIDNGMLSVATVPKDKKGEFDAVHDQMMQNVEKVKAKQQQGQPVQLCEYCTAMSELMKAGANKQDIETETGDICLVTSNDAAVIQKIHALADKAIAEQLEMAQSR